MTITRNYMKFSVASKVNIQSLLYVSSTTYDNKTWNGVSPLLIHTKSKVNVDFSSKLKTFGNLASS